MPASPRQRSHLICSAPCPAMTAMPRGRPQTAAPPSTPAPLGLTAYFLCCCVTQDRDPAAADLERSRSRTVRPVRLHPPDGGRRGRRTRTPEVMGLLLRAGAAPPCGPNLAGATPALMATTLSAKVRRMSSHGPQPSRPTQSGEPGKLPTPNSCRGRCVPVHLRRADDFATVDECGSCTNRSSARSLAAGCCRLRSKPTFAATSWPGAARSSHNAEACRAGRPR
jgi:hypothetical protein